MIAEPPIRSGPLERIVSTQRACEPLPRKLGVRLEAKDEARKPVQALRVVMMRQCRAQRKLERYDRVRPEGTARERRLLGAAVLH